MTSSLLLYAQSYFKIFYCSYPYLNSNPVDNNLDKLNINEN